MKNAKINASNNDKDDRRSALGNTRNRYLQSQKSIALSKNSGNSEKISLPPGK